MGSKEQPAEGHSDGVDGLGSAVIVAHAILGMLDATVVGRSPLSDQRCFNLADFGSNVLVGVATLA